MSYCAGKGLFFEHHLMKPSAADHYSLFSLQRRHEGLKSSSLSLTNSVQCVLYEPTCSKPHWCCTGLHNSGFRSCHVGVPALYTGRSTDNSL